MRLSCTGLIHVAREAENHTRIFQRVASILGVTCFLSLEFAVDLSFLEMESPMAPPVQRFGPCGLAQQRVSEAREVLHLSSHFEAPKIVEIPA
jgi:hypothetical protein